MRRLVGFRLLREENVSARRRVITALLTVVAVILSSWNDYADYQLNYLALLGLALVSVVAAMVSTVALYRMRWRSKAEEVFWRNARLLRRAARTIPQRRDAPVLSYFRGREDVLAHWRDEHRRLQNMRRDGGPQELSPIVLAMHGPPGTGKSAIAHALSRLLAKEYPDSLAVASFGTGGTSRGPADIARDLLLQLGWPEKDMPGEAEDRVATLRSLSRKKRMIFLFDAVRDHDQVTQVMPSGPGCLVIITSRREIGTSLGLPARKPIGPMTLHDSLAMFTAISGMDWTHDAETAVEVAEMCGRLPLAVRSAAERVRDGEVLRYVAATMRPARARLDALNHGGRSVRDRIETEFDRLTRRQQQALTLLASLDSDSFVPWVLRPLMRLEKGESNRLVASLAAAQFVEEDGEDHTGKARYRIQPLIRLYAIQRQDPADLADAGRRFHEAYLELIDDVLVEHDPTYTRIRSGDRVWRSRESTIAGKIAPNLDEIVRREYLNLIRVIRDADPHTHAGLIWRVAAMLDGRTPAFPPSVRTPDEQARDILGAFDHAAGLASGPSSLDVGLARAQFLIAIERYRDAVADLDRIRADIDELARDGSADALPLQLREARVRAWLLTEVGAFGPARRVLASVDPLLDSLPETAGLSRHLATDAELLIRLNRDIQRTVPAHRWSRFNDPAGSGEIVRFHSALAQAEELRRARYWDDAAEILREQLNRDGDARSHTTTHYRLAQLLLDHATELDDRDRPDPRLREVTRDAIQHAAACIVTFGDIDDPVGQIRGRALLIRALVLAGDTVSATQLDIEVNADLTAARREAHQQADAHIYLDSLTALYHRAHADVEVVHGRLETAWRSLVTAVGSFRRLGDWWNHADAWRVLHEVYPKLPDNRREIEISPDDRARDQDAQRDRRERTRRP